MWPPPTEPPADDFCPELADLVQLWKRTQTVRFDDADMIATADYIRACKMYRKNHPHFQHYAPDDKFGDVALQGVIMGMACKHGEWVPVKGGKIIEG